MKKLIGVVFSLLSLTCLAAFAQVLASPTPVPLTGAPVVAAAPAQWFLDIISKYPKLSILFFVVGGLRMTLKPLFAFAHQFFQGWGLVSWDKAETDLESSKPMKVVYFLLDYLGSVKVPVVDKSETLIPPKV